MGPKIKKYKSGLTLVYRKSKRQEAVYVNFMVHGGLFNDPVDKLGLSHLLEHCVFLSNNKRTKKEKSELRREFSSLNAFTNRESIAFEGYAANNQFKNVFECLTNMLTDITLPQEEFDNEKNVVKQEILRFRENIHSKTSDVTGTMLYGMPYEGIRAFGTTDCVDKITREDVLEYIKKFIVQKNMQITVCGDVSYWKTKHYIKKYVLKAFDVGEEHKYTMVNDYKYKLNKPSMKQAPSPDDKRSNVYIMHRYVLPSYDKKYGRMTRIINNIFRNCAFDYFRDQKGLSYDPRGGFSVKNLDKKTVEYLDYDLAMSCDESNVKKVLEELPGYYQYIKEYLVNKENLAEAKYNLENKRKTSNPPNIMNRGVETCDEYFTYGKFPKRGEGRKIKKIVDKLKPKDFNLVFKEVLELKPYIVVVSNTQDELPKYNDIVKQINKNLKWLKEI